MAIEARELSKDYQIYVGAEDKRAFLRHFRRQPKTISAIRSLNLSVEHGEVVALIGENGSGKSTTIKLLTGILKPTSGSARVMDINPFRQRVLNARNISAVMGQKTQLWWDLPVYRSFEMLRVTYGIPETTFRQRQAEFVDMLNLSELMKKPVRTLSLGQRVRCDIVAGLLHRPKILFLDEPTIGLDYKVKSDLYRFLRFCNDQYKTTIVLTSHDLEDVETLCDRIVVLEKGRLILDQKMSMFMKRLGGDRLATISLKRPAQINPSFGVLQSRTDQSVRIVFDSTQLSDIDVFRLASGQSEIDDVSIAKVSLRDVIAGIENTEKERK